MALIVLLALSVLGFIPSRAGECEWDVRLCKTEPVSTEMYCLGTSGMDVRDLDPVEMQKSMEFPYYLKLDLQCGFKESSGRAVLEDSITGLTPEAVVTFQEPTHPTHFRPQRLEVELSVASLSDNATCGSEMCEFSWYAPMPIINGSVVYRVKVKSIEMGSQQLHEKSFALNVNGYMVTTEKGENEASFGTEIQAIEDVLRVGSPSHPLWSVVDHAPVLLLPGIPGLAAVLMTATEFQHTSLIEVSLKSPSGSRECLQVESSMIQETLSTESSLFVIHNQELYRFLGNYSLLPLRVPPSDAWEKLLSAVCVSGLVPVSVPHHGREYFYVLGGGLQSGTLYRAEVYDGDVTFTELVDSIGFTACEIVAFYKNLKRSTVNNPGCQVRSAAQNAQTDVTDIILVELLFHEDQEHSYILLTFDGDFQMTEILPEFILYSQRQRHQETSSLNLKFNGMTLNPSTGILYIWGNSLIFSYILTWEDEQSFWHDSGFPSDQMIKYFTLSYDGTFVFVTEQEELWWGQERTDSVFRLRPSQGWNELSHLQALSGDHSTLTVFYDGDKELQEVLYTVDLDGKGSVVKRKIPVVEILSFSHLPFLSTCPFDLEYSVPHIESFNRLQRYSFNPQLVTSSSELHPTRSLALYQGLVYHLLQLHAQYLMVIGDPKESPISRMEHSCNGVLYKVTVTDKGMVEGQVFPGEKLLPFSVLFRIGISPRQCFQQTDRGMVLSGLQNLPVYIGCPPGNRLVFDASTAVLEAVRLNRRNFSCLNPDPVTPCFYYKNLFFPILLIQDVVLGESRKFLGSYTFKIVGGGPHSRKNIQLYTPEEVLRYNSLNYRSQKARIWDIKGCKDDRTTCNVTEDGFFIFNGTRNNGIRWLCQPNSPCADVLSKNPAVSPRFFFIIEVSNRDTETYCSHTFRFDILVHDFPMSSSRKCYIVLVTVACFVGVMVTSRSIF
uniref:Cation channel sperm-associated protein subunit gamma n=1 Tax=Cyprinus carpio TaxID=7962 RepID=A0A8C2EFI8_CYPCA